MSIDFHGKRASFRGWAVAWCASITLGAASIAAAATGGVTSSPYAGNGASGFGGPVGQGSLTIANGLYVSPPGSTSDPLASYVGQQSVIITFTPYQFHPTLDGNNLVVYLSTGAAGLADTSSLTDTGGTAGTNSDYGHTAISGYNNFSQNPASRSTIIFPSGFAANYAISFAGAYDGIFSMPTDGSGNLGYVGGVSPSSQANLQSVNIPLAALGLSPGQKLSFVGTDIDGSASYRSNEAFGDANVSVGTYNGDLVAYGGDPGFNNQITFTDFDSFTTTPEPTAMGLIALIGGAAARRRRISR